jgi:transcriptional regulator with GAF, ATPase, and Fis domain
VVLCVDATAESLRTLSEVVLRRRRFAPDAAAVTLLASATERPRVPALREVPVEALTRSASQRLLDALHGVRMPASAVEAFCEVSAGLAGRMVDLARRVGPAGIASVTRATLYAALAREPTASSHPLGPRAATLLATLLMLGETPVSHLRDAHDDEDLAALLRVGAVHRRGAAVRADPSCALRDLDDAARREGARRVLALGSSRDATRGMARAWAHAALGDLPRAWDDAVCAATRPDVPRDLALRWFREATPWAQDRTAHQRLLATLCLGGGDPQGALDALDGDGTPEADALRVEALRRAGRRDDARALAARLHHDSDPACRELGALALARDALDRGDPAPAAALAETGVSAAREPWSLELQSLAALARDDLDLADELLARATLLAARAQDLPRRHRLRTLEGIVALRRGDASLALRAHRDALELALAQGDLEAAASYRVNLGGAALDAGDLGEALRSLERSLEPLSAPGRARPLARALGNLASLLAWIGDAPAATRLAARAEEAARDAEDPVAQGFASGVGAELRGDLDALCAAAETCALHGDPARGGELRARASARAAELGDVTRARALLPPGDDAMTTLAALAVELSAGASPHALREALARCDRAASDDGSVEHALWHLKLSESVARRVGESHRAEALRARRDARARALAATLPPALAETFVRTWGAPAAVVAGTDARWRQLAAVTHGLNGEARLPELLERVMDAVITLTGAERGMVLLRDETGALEPAVARDGEARALSDEARAFSRSVAERVARSGEALVTFDAASDARFDAAASVAAMQLRSILAVPLRVRDAVVGTVYVDDRLRAGAFDDGAVQVVQAFADAAALAIQNARTRRALEDALRRAERLSEQLDAVVAQQRAELEVTRESRSPDGVRGSYPDIIGRGPAMTRVLALIDRVAPTSMPVLLLGESGPGKELVARAVHAQSPRRAAAFVAENCGAIPETLLESVLFGHVRGAFTGADRARAGLFEAADGGTLFLDEIGEMSLAMQSRLLRVLQEGEVRPVGGSAMRRVDVRVIAATHRDLGEMVRAGRFREDLYYRLAVLVLPVPALRERREDIPALVAHFLAKHGGASIARSALARLVAAPWQGNVRELENVLRRAAALAPTGTVRDEDLALAPDPAGRANAPDGDIRHAVSEVERTLVEKALRAHRGNQSRAAKALGLSRFGLQKKLKRLGISARAIADEG